MVNMHHFFYYLKCHLFCIVLCISIHSFICSFLFSSHVSSLDFLNNDNHFFHHYVSLMYALCNTFLLVQNIELFI